MPGKTPLSSNDVKLRTAPFMVVKPHGLGKSFPAMMTPPLGPRRVLWVVDVTTWQWGSGLSSRPEAISPDGCEMSAKRMAPTSSAMARNLA